MDECEDEETYTLKNAIPFTYDVLSNGYTAVKALPTVLQNFLARMIIIKNEH